MHPILSEVCHASTKSKLTPEYSYFRLSNSGIERVLPVVHLNLEGEVGKYQHLKKNISLHLIGLKMTARSVRVTLADMLDDLPGKNFDDFVDQLLDCGEEPRVRRNRVEGKSRLEVVDVLVSTFTETGAVRVSVEVLKQINCHEQANKLGELSGRALRPRFVLKCLIATV